MRLTAFTLLALAATVAAPARSQPVPGFALYHAFYDLRAPRHTHVPKDMNKHLQVVGDISFWAPEYRPQGFRWTPPRRLELTEDFASGLEFSRLAAVNNHGLAVGFGVVERDGEIVHRALALRADGRRLMLPHPGAPTELSAAVDVNDGGTVLGTVYGRSLDNLYAVLWHADGRVERLDGVPPDVLGLNTRGDIVGRVGDQEGFFREASGALHAVPLAVRAVNAQGVVAGARAPRAPTRPYGRARAASTRCPCRRPRRGARRGT